MERVQVDILGLSTSPASGGAYALILKEMGGNRRLPIIIGAFEAQSIALEMEGIKPPRPLTHDLMKTIIDRMGFLSPRSLSMNFETEHFTRRSVSIPRKLILAPATRLHSLCGTVSLSTFQRELWKRHRLCRSQKATREESFLCRLRKRNRQI